MRKRHLAMLVTATAALAPVLAGVVDVARPDATTAAAAAASATPLRTDVAPGGNFDLSTWQLQLPVGSPGAPTTIPPSALRGADGYTHPAYFWTDQPMAAKSRAWL